jgi:hypothetical protein
MDPRFSHLASYQNPGLIADFHHSQATGKGFDIRQLDRDVHLQSLDVDPRSPDSH